MTKPNENDQLFILRAFQRVAKDRVDDYIANAIETNGHVQDVEPGMLIHSLSVVEETDDYVEYCWSEVFDGSAGFQAHLDNPFVGPHVEFLNDGVLVAPIRLEFHCDWDDDLKAYWTKELEGLEIEFVTRLAGHYRKR